MVLFYSDLKQSTDIFNHPLNHISALRKAKQQFHLEFDFRIRNDLQNMGNVSMNIYVQFIRT